MRALLWSLLLATLPLYAQISLREAVRLAGEQYPAVQASLQDARAAAAGVQLARTAFLPKADFLAQVNRATHNNVPGMLLPQPVIPGISGPPRLVNAGDSIWGTATGFLVNWEPFDFGLREARTGAARAVQARTEAAVARTRLEAETAAADAFLTVLAAEQTARSAQAGWERAQAFQKVVEALAASGLRPGADAARARAEVALAESQTIQAEAAWRSARAALAQFTGREAPALTPPGVPPVRLETGAGEHPALREQRAATQESDARMHVLDKSWMPRVSAQSALYARGTGADSASVAQGGAAGLGPNIYNWGLGFTITIPLLEGPGLKAEKEAEAARRAAAQSRFDLARRELATHTERAAAQLDAAIRIRRLAPVQLEAARSAEEQAQARYRAGLAAITEVAEAQRLRLQAEVDDALAELNIWRAYLAVAAAAGDLRPLLDAAGK